jgi:hypothetical protein
MITVIETRTSGRTSAAMRPSERATRTTSQVPAMWAMTSLTRESAARAMASRRSSSFTLAASSREAIGSFAAYRAGVGFCRCNSGARRREPAAAIARVVSAAACSAARLMSSE